MTQEEVVAGVIDALERAGIIVRGSSLWKQYGGRAFAVLFRRGCRL